MGLRIGRNKVRAQTFTMNQYATLTKKQGAAAAEAAYQEALAQGKLIINDVIADNMLNKSYSIRKIQCNCHCNLNGDYLSDALAAQVGGIGIAPGGNINYQTGHAIFEATHGTAPDIAGLGKANPCSMLLSGSMLLDYLGWQEAGRLVE